MILSKEDLVFALDIINQCLYARSQEDMQRIFDHLGDYLGISGGIIGQTESMGMSHLNEADVHGYGVAKKWVIVYDDENFANIDPIIPFAVKKYTPHIMGPMRT